MRGMKSLKWFLAALILALPLVFNAAAQAESGCHRGGNPPGGVTRDLPPRD